MYTNTVPIHYTVQYKFTVVYNGKYVHSLHLSRHQGGGGEDFRKDNALIKIQIDKPTVLALGGNCPRFIFFILYLTLHDVQSLVYRVYISISIIDILI